MGTLLEKLLLSLTKSSTSLFNHAMMKGIIHGALICFLAILTACTVRPLYFSSNTKNNKQPDIHEKLLLIAIIDSSDDHMTQLARNHLIYLLSGGIGQATSPVYHLTLIINSNIQKSVYVSVGSGTPHGGRPSAGKIVAVANYILQDVHGNLLFSRKCSVTSSFDRPQQEYANLQAEQDAKKRAAEELAERVFLSLSQNIAYY